METPPRFNLEQAIAAWRQELASHPGPAPDDLRALEAHLRDGFAEMKGRQLSDEEAFLVARHRVGPLPAVAGEFAKAAPKRVWASRVFWLVFGAWGAFLWKVTIEFSFLQTPILQRSMWAKVPEWFEIICAAMIWVLVNFAPVILAGYWLVRGVPQSVLWLLSTRGRVAMVSLGISLGVFVLFQFSDFLSYRIDCQWPPDYWDDVMGYHNPEDIYITFVYYLCPMFLSGLLIWLAPSGAKARAVTTVKA